MSARDVLTEHLNSDTLARAAISELDAAGFAIVPIEPTEAMTEAGLATQWNDPYPQAWVRKIYRAMLAAAVGTLSGEE